MKIRHAGTRLALLVYTAGVILYRDALMDDTFIHLQYARNLRQLGELSFNAGEPSLGLTSPLWLLLLSALGPSLQVARLASVACGAISVVVFGVIARRLLGTAGFATAATVAWAGSLWLVRHAPNGMETTLAVLTLLMCIELRTREGGHRRRDLLFGMTLGAACLTRPEAALLALVLTVHDLRSSSGRSGLMVWLPVCLTLCLAWAVFTTWKTGLVIPSTGTAKSGGLEWHFWSWFQVLVRQARILAAGQVMELLAMAAALILALRLDGRTTFGRLLEHPLAPYGIFSLSLILGFALGDVQVQPRYLLLVVPCVTLLGFIAWSSLLGGGSLVALSFCLLSLSVSVTVSALRVYPTTRTFSRGLLTALRPLADEVAARAHSHSCVASPDIGVIGFYGHVRVLDLGGLVERRIQKLTKEVGFDSLLVRGDFLDFCAADFVIDRSHQPERFRNLRTRNLLWKPLRTTRIENIGLSHPGPFYYTLYALQPESQVGLRSTKLPLAQPAARTPEPAATAKPAAVR